MENNNELVDNYSEFLIEYKPELIKLYSTYKEEMKDVTFNQFTERLYKEFTNAETSQNKED